MKLKQKKYTLWNLVPMLIAMAPGAMGVSIAANALIGVMPVLNAMATAWFIDSALLMAAGGKSLVDMILPTAMAFLMQLADYSRWELDNYGMHSIQRGIHAHYRPAIAAKVAALEYRLIEDGETWNLIHRMSENPQGKMFDLLDGVMYLFQLAMGAAGIIIMVTSQVWWAGALIVVCMLPIIAVSLWMGEKAYAVRAKISTQKRRLNELERTCMSRECAEERALFGYAEKISEEFEQETMTAWQGTFRYWKLNSVNNNLMRSLFALVMAVTAIILVRPAIGGVMSVGMLIALIREIITMSTRMGGLSYCMRCLGEGRAYAEELTKFAFLPEREGALDDPSEPPVEFETLEFRHVTFAYPGAEREILTDFSLRMEKGKHYAFVGVNGAGKTTMTKLICGLYDQFEGEILLNGRDIRSYSQAQLKSLCAPVFQDFARYEVSMKDSIALGFEERERKISQVAEAVGLNEAVNVLSKGMDTPLGKTYEGGQDLSGGQWQRLAIARALVKDAPLRILDEPTAALDPISESQFYERFGELSQGVTTLFISHRLGSTRLADRIFVIDGGRIAEEGTQSELLQKKGLYAEMFEAQRSWYQ